MANPIADWLKRWGLLILVGLAAGLYLLLKFLPFKTGAIKALDESRAAAAGLKDEKTAALATITKQMDERAAELKTIQAIPDEAERLKALSDFANRQQ